MHKETLHIYIPYTNIYESLPPLVLSIYYVYFNCLNSVDKLRERGIYIYLNLNMYRHIYTYLYTCMCLNVSTYMFVFIIYQRTCIIQGKFPIDHKCKNSSLTCKFFI